MLGRRARLGETSRAPELRRLPGARTLRSDVRARPRRCGGTRERMTRDRRPGGARNKIGPVASTSDGTPSELPSGVDIFTAAPDGVVVVDDAGCIAIVNQLAGDMFGYEPSELIGLPIEALLPERYRDHHIEHRKAFTEHPSRRPMGLELSLFGRRKNGEEFPVDISLNHQRDTQGALKVVA